MLRLYDMICLMLAENRCVPLFFNCPLFLVSVMVSGLRLVLVDGFSAPALVYSTDMYSF